MRCDRFREAVSARIDGEDPGLPDAVLDAHLDSCADCRAWQQRAHAATRRMRLGGSSLDHDLTARILAAAPAKSAPRRRELTQRAGLAAMAAVQLAITVPLLLLGHDHDAGAHAAHELGSFDLSLAIAFAVGAVRPALAPGLAWPCAIAAAGLTGTAILDLIRGQTLGADEAQHLVAVAGALLLIWAARTNGGKAADAFRDETGTYPASPAMIMTGQGDFRVDGPPDLPGGGEVAAAPAPDAAANAGDSPAGHARLGAPARENEADDTEAVA